MKIEGYDIDLEKAAIIINNKKFKKVILQIPDGLKIYFNKFVEFFETNTKADVFISADPCFGACDLFSGDLKNLAIDFVIHIGHESIYNKTKISPLTFFVNAKTDLDLLKIVEKAIPFLKEKKIGLVSTAQHVHKLDQVKKLLENKNFEVFIGKGDKRIKLPGQIIGCNFSAATTVSKKVDIFLFIGSGNFHPLGLMLITKKKVIACDPYTNEVKEKELVDLKEMVLRQRYGAIARSKNARVFGILIGTKTGQQQVDLAYKIKEKLNTYKKKSYFFVLNNFTPLKIQSFLGIDCLISTACPRIAIDDYLQYKIPIITPIELDILLGFKKWNEYCFDEILNI